MLLTVSTTHQPATDLGYLLHKNPARLQTEELSFGKAYVFYPDASVDLCTAALLVEIDLIALVRGSGSSGEGGQLEQYVNDRPYTTNSFLSVAMGRIFNTAMSACGDSYSFDGTSAGHRSSWRRGFGETSVRAAGLCRRIEGLDA